MLTNAHVVAGANQVQVQSPAGWLDRAGGAVRPGPRHRGARVPGLTAQPLALADRAWPSPARTRSCSATRRTARSTSGRPGCGTGRRITGHDIYGQLSVDRDIYTIRSVVRAGNSGGPLIDTNGSVLGIVFASALDSADTGFVLTAQEIAADAASGRTATAAVSTGDCD